MDTIASTIVHNISDKKSELSISVESHPETLPFSKTAWLIPRLSSVLFIALLVYWIFTEQNGFSDFMPSMIAPVGNVQANGYLGYHALGLSLWAVVCNQESIMAYAIPLCGNTSYRIRKYTHVIAQMVGLICGIGGMVSILYYKNSSVSIPVSGNSFVIMNDVYYIPYSPHAWLGILFMSSWMIQCIGRFFPAYLTPDRHRFLGRFIYTTGLACCGLGLQQQQTRQLMTSIQLLSQNTTLSSPTKIVSNWWFSQPSLGVLLLGATCAATFFYGLI